MEPPESPEAVEAVEAVDVSWLHHSSGQNKLERTRSAPSTHVSPSQEAPQDNLSLHEHQGVSSTNSGAKLATTTQPEPFFPGNTPSTPSRRRTWISSLSAKFSPAAQREKDGLSNNNNNNNKPTQPTNAKEKDKEVKEIKDLQIRTSKLDQVAPNEASKPLSSTLPSPSSTTKKDTRKDAKINPPSTPSAVSRNGSAPFSPHSPQQGRAGFFQTAIRKISNSSGIRFTSTDTRNGSCVMERRVINADPNRDRPRIPSLKENTLKRVAFCVDIEIAGISALAQTQNEVAQEAKEEAEKEKAKERERESIKETEEENGLTVSSSRESGDAPIPATSSEATNAPEEENPPQDQQSLEKAEELLSPTTRKQEKKKRTEGERKERREKRRRRDEQSGTIPMQFSRNERSHQEDPTTDPVRIYRRCCQLRETGVLKRIVAEISAPSSLLADEPGTVAVLDLSGFRMKEEDFITFCDWLALVPVRKLVLRNCSLKDHELRLVLSSLLSTKTIDLMLRRRMTKEAAAILSSDASVEQKRKAEHDYVGAIERLDLRDNRSIGVDGWRHIALFVHMSRSLRAIDLSGCPIPSRDEVEKDVQQRQTKETDRTEEKDNLGKIAALATAKLGDRMPHKAKHQSQQSQQLQSQQAPTHQQSHAEQENGVSEDLEISALLSKALSQRLAGCCLQELLFSECALNNKDVERLCDAARTIRLRRLGLANNAFDKDVLPALISHYQAGACEGLDLGGNDIFGGAGKIDMHSVRLMASSISSATSLAALSLADCQLTPEMLEILLPAFAQLPNFRFIDISHNKGLFESKPERSIALLRKYLPRMPILRRIHLVDVGLSPDAAISLAEIILDCHHLCHINILENAAIAELTSEARTKDPASQESACAVYASYMIAARLSRTLVAVDIEVPSPGSNDVVRALASQTVAYTLRNLANSELGMRVSSESGAPGDTATSTGEDYKKTVPVPDVLVQIVGNDSGTEPVEPEFMPNDDYVVSGSGVVKALNVFLENLEHDKNGMPLSSSRRPSGVAHYTPDEMPSSAKKESHDMVKNLLNSARKIRTRLQSAMVREDIAHNQQEYRRLLFLDRTLEGMIDRFESTFPDTGPQAKPAPESSAPVHHWNKLSNIFGNAYSSLPQDTSNQESAVVDEDDVPDNDPLAVRLSRTNSNTSLHSKWLTFEEGRIHRASQHVRRDIIETSERSRSNSIAPSDDEDDDKGMALNGGRRSNRFAAAPQTLSESPNPGQLLALRDKIRRFASPSRSISPRPGSRRNHTPSGVRSPTRRVPTSLLAQKALSNSSSSSEHREQEPDAANRDAAEGAADDGQAVGVEQEGEVEEGMDTDPLALEKLDTSVSELMNMDPDSEDYKKFRQSQIAAQFNASLGR